MSDGEIDSRRVELGLWQDVRSEFTFTAPRRALFLDRDGVLNRDNGYVGSLAQLEILTNCAPLIRAANAVGSPVIIVTNQSGIGRGFYDWSAFAQITELIIEAFKEHEARIDAVFACAYHKNGRDGFAVVDHPWRKPKPGMLMAAATHLPVDLKESLIVGDKLSDMQAGVEAGLNTGILLSSALCDVDSSLLPKEFKLQRQAISTANWSDVAREWYHETQ